MNLSRSSLKIFIANIGSAGVQFAGISYFARILGPAEIGVFFLFQALLGMIAIPVDFGMRGALEKRISEGSEQARFFAAGLVLKCSLSLVAAFLIYIMSGYINSYVDAQVAHILIFGVVAQELAYIFMSLLKGELRAGETAVLELLRQVVWFVSAATLVAYGFSAEGVIYGLVLAFILIFVLGLHRSSVTIARPSTSHFQSLVAYGKYNMLTSVGGYFYSWMDVVIIGLFLTQTDVGGYEVAWRISGVVILFSRSIATVLFPQVSKWYSQQEAERIRSATQSLLIPSMILAIPSVFGAVVIGREILTLVFGSDYAFVWLILIVLMVEKVSQSIYVILNRVLQAIGKPDLAARATVLSMSVNLFLNVTLILQFGLIGAAVATTVSSLINTVLHWRYLKEFVQVEFPFAEMGWYTFSATLMAVSIIGLKLFVKIQNIPELLLAIVVGVIVYSGVALTSQTIRSRAITEAKRMLV